MYESFYGLRDEPFRLTPDSQYAFEHSSRSRAKAYLEYGIGRGEGVVMVTGEPGSGKTTLVEHLVASLPRTTRVANLVSTQLEATDLLRMVLFGFGLDATTRSKSDALVAIQRFLQSGHERGHSTVLVVDEAQDLATEALEELRLLTNVTQDGRPLLQVLLVGQDELLERVRSPGLEQLHQRIVAAYRLRPLDEGETRAYIEQRLRVAGWIGNPRITELAMQLIHRVSRGNPRRINMLCGRLLLYGYVDELHSLTVADVRNVVEEMGHENLVLDTDALAGWEEIESGDVAERLRKPGADLRAFTDRNPAADIVEPVAKETTGERFEERAEARFPTDGPVAMQAAPVREEVQSPWARSEPDPEPQRSDESGPKPDFRLHDHDDDELADGEQRVARPWRDLVYTNSAREYKPAVPVDADLPPIFAESMEEGLSPRTPFRRESRAAWRRREKRRHPWLIVFAALVVALLTFSMVSGVPGDWRTLPQRWLQHTLGTSATEPASVAGPATMYERVASYWLAEDDGSG